MVQISFINVGYGDSILIECNDGDEKFVILVDGGKPDEGHYKGLSKRIKTIDYLKEKGIDKINLLVVSHLHEDHVGGLSEVVKLLEVDELWSNFTFPEELRGKIIDYTPEFCEDASRLINALNIYNEMCCTMLSREKTVREISRTLPGKKLTDALIADIIVPDEDVVQWQKKLVDSIYCEDNKKTVESCLIELNENINNTSIVLRIIYRDKRVLLPGDIYNSSWENILASSIPLKSDIFKISHHGRMDSISRQLIEMVSPSYIIVSVSNDRKDNCPDPEAINLIKSCLSEEVEILFTDAVNMPPYSTGESIHKAVVFYVGDVIEYKFI